MTTHRLLRRTVVASCCIALAAAAAAVLPPQLKLDAETAQQHALDAVQSGQVPGYWGQPVWNAATLELRVTLVRGALAWFKDFTASPAFASAYAKLRDDAKPTPPEYELTVDQELAKQAADQKQSADGMREAIKQMPPEQRKQMEEVIKQMEASQKQMAADPQFKAMQRQSLVADRAQKQQDYQQALKDWQRDWPADAKQLLARRLREFLAACDGVDFAAKLLPAEADGRRRFADPDHQSKPDQWKQCYRAGKAPVDAARAFASAWLKELPAQPK